METSLYHGSKERKDGFQKDLIVWKLRSRKVNTVLQNRVSEGLNSVETSLDGEMPIITHKFQKDLIVWKPSSA